MVQGAQNPDGGTFSSGFTWANYKAEIDAGRPVIIQLDGHTMLGYGYSGSNTVDIYDTWNSVGETMTWGGSYGGMAQWGVMALTLPEPSTLALVAVSALVGLIAYKRRRAR